MIGKFISWLKSLFSSSHSLDMYKPNERNIYKYHNGQSWIRADPMVLYKRIMEKAPEIQVEMSVSNSISKDAIKAHSDLINRLRGIFDIKTLEAGGLTESEVIQLFDHFMEYVDTIKKNSRKLATPQEESKASKTSSVEGPPTPSSSESGSTKSEDSSKEQEKLPTAVE